MQPTTTKINIDDQALKIYGLEGIEVLVGLGLSSRQAKVFLALLALGESRARAIGTLSTIPRQEVYCLLEDLKQLGLIEQSLTMPATYSAVTLNSAIELLIERRENDIANASTKAKQFIQKFNQTKIGIVANPKPSFGIICEGSCDKKFENGLLQAKRHVDVVTSWERFKQASLRFEAPLKEAIRKDVTVRIAFDKPPNHKLPKWVNEASEKYLNYKLAFLSSPLKAVVAIFDYTQAAITISPAANLSAGPTVWTTNHSLVALAQTYIDSIWAAT
ncbi:MAG: hypothetical protein NWE93_00665 [Candidatus Bathyarchaeota archaeon]|nr:hypothetical protein [Candidatus Bathyarchaeota archaeon]